MPLTILIADQEPISRYGTIHWVRKMFKSAIIYTASDFDSLNKKLQGNQIDLLLYDLRLSDSNSYETIKRIRQTKVGTKIIVFSRQPTELYAVRFLRAGAHCYLCKSCGWEEFCNAVRITFSHRRKYWHDSLSKCFNANIDLLNKLSDRELEIGKLLLQGYGIIEIAQTLHVHESTVSTHRIRMYRKLGIKKFNEFVSIVENAIPSWQQANYPDYLRMLGGKIRPGLTSALAR